MDNPHELRFTLPTKKIIVNAFLTPWLLRNELLRKVSLPILLMMSLGFVEPYLNDESKVTGYIFGLASLLIYAFLAVTCHRIVILGGESVPQLGIRKWTMRETRFFGWLLGMYIIMFFILVAVTSFSLPFFLLFDHIDMPLVWLIYFLTMLPALYLFSRLSMIFPATAVDERPDIRWAWDITHGNGWRMVLIVGVLPAVTAYVLSLLERLDSTALEDVVVTLITYIVLIIEISALSLAYKELRNKNPAAMYKSM